MDDPESAEVLIPQDEGGNNTLTSIRGDLRRISESPIQRPREMLSGRRNE